MLRSAAQQPFLECSVFTPVPTGVTIINFIRLSWEQDELEREMYGEAADRALRPVWRMTEGFERAYTLQVRVCTRVLTRLLLLSRTQLSHRCNLIGPVAAVQKQRRQEATQRRGQL